MKRENKQQIEKKKEYFFTGIIIYVCAAICLTLCTICYICKFRYVKNEIVTPYIRNHRLLNKLVADVRPQCVL